MTHEDDFFQRLRATFAVEAEEHLAAMAAGLLRLEQQPFTPDLVEPVFRAAHSLKGAARAVDFTEVETESGALEDLFAQWKGPAGAPDREAFDLAHRLLDRIAAATRHHEPLAKSAAPTPPLPAATAREASPSAAPPPVMAQDETVRIAVSALDARLLEAEEMLAAKLGAHQRMEDLRDLSTRVGAWTKEWSGVESDARALRQAAASAGGRVPPAMALRLVEFAERTVDHLKSVATRVTTMTRTAEHDALVIAKLVDDLLVESKKLLLLPFGRLATALPHVARGLCRDQGKEAEIVIRGEDVHIDKRVLEQVKDPLIHLLRNAVDHGIEMPTDRQRAGKTQRGTITIAAAAIDGQKVALEVSDDGAGIDPERIRRAAVERGVITEAEARQMPDREAAALIFETGFSTRAAVTRISGRGLGLAIVREAVERLGGRVTVESRPGAGTRFSLVLPSTLATFRGVLVEVAQRRFVVPALQVERVLRVRRSEIHTVEGRETVTIGDRVFGVVRIAAVLELTEAAAVGEARADVVLVLLGVGEQRVAFAVDAVVDEQEVLVKQLRPPLVRVRYIAGATVLGSGRVVPILDTADLLQAAVRGASVAPRPAAAPAGARQGTGKSVLVAEDSITSRMLIKGMLESAGYRVTTAVDGADALARLRTERFDLLVSDVEMPRLDGFALTSRIRADARLADLPVVLITALDTAEDRARGVDAGANAYIVKSRLDQDGLLDVLRRLV